MTRHLPLLAAALALAPGCKKKSEAPIPPTVDLVSPAGNVHARGAVAVQLIVGGGPVEAVELLRDGAVLARVSPPYAYTWDTTADPEGPHQLQARASGAGGEAESAVATVVVDRTAPRVTLRDPGPDQTNVAVGARLRVQFDEPLLPGSVTQQTLVLTGPGGTPLAATVVLADATTVAVDLPTTEVPATLTATLGAGLTDLAGNPVELPADPTWSFTLPLWHALGEKLSSPGWDEGTTPAVAVDATGAVWCVWLRLTPAAGTPAEAGNVVVQRWNGSGWDQVGASLDTGPHTQLAPPDIAIDPGGAPVVLWADEAARHVVRWNGQTWVALGSSTDLAYTDPIFSFLTSGPSGLVAGWSGISAGIGLEAFSKRWDGAAWQAIGQPVDLLAESAAEHAGEYWMAGFANGSAHAQRWDGSLWVSEGSFNSGSISLGAGSDALAASVAVPVSCPSGSCAAVQVHLWNGTGFERVGGDPAAGASPRIVGRTRVRIGPTGLPVVAWNADDAAGTYVTVSAWDGAAWRPAALSMAGPTNPVSLALDPAGVPIFAAAVLDTATSTIQARVFRLNR